MMVESWFKEKAEISWVLYSLVRSEIGRELKFHCTKENCSYSHVIIPQIFTEFFKFAKYCSSYWQYNNEEIR